MHARSAYSPARPRGGEREVRRLLRGLQRPHLLHAEPVARMLCDVYGLETPHDAVIRLVHEALPTQRGSASMHLREIIERCVFPAMSQRSIISRRCIDADPLCVGSASWTRRMTASCGVSKP